MKINSLSTTVVKNVVLSSVLAGAMLFMYSSSALAWARTGTNPFHCKKVCDPNRCFLVVDYITYSYPYKVYLDNGFCYKGQVYNYYHRYFIYEGDHYHTYYYYTYPSYFYTYY